MSSAKHLLTIAEAYDHYLASCAASPMNAEARKACVYAPSYLVDSDAQRLTTLVRSLDLLRDTDVIILNSTADNGYPHTRPKSVICMPAGFVASSTNEELEETLCHEAFHIHQRRFPALWKDFCISQGWTPLANTDIPSRFRNKCRLNPDTFYDTPFWAWDTYYAPLPMFKEGFKTTLDTVNIEWLDLRTGAIFHSPPESFTETNGSPSQPEHPYEIYAVLFAKKGIQTAADLMFELKQLTP